MTTIARRTPAEATRIAGKAGLASGIFFIGYCIPQIPSGFTQRRVRKFQRAIVEFTSRDGAVGYGECQGDPRGSSSFSLAR